MNEVIRMVKEVCEPNFAKDFEKNMLDRMVYVVVTGENVEVFKTEAMANKYAKRHGARVVRKKY